MPGRDQAVSYGYEPDRASKDWARLAELSYDAANDVLEIATHGADRAIHRPARIYVRDEDGLQSIEVVDGEGRRDFVIFKEPLHLAELTP